MLNNKAPPRSVVCEVAAVDAKVLNCITELWKQSKETQEVNIQRYAKLGYWSMKTTLQNLNTEVMLNCSVVASLVAG